MHRTLLALAVSAALPLAALSARAAEVAVTARDAGFSTSCAEMDNVLVALEGPEVTRFTIRARHPFYTAAVPPREASYAADFTGCVFPEEPIWDFDRQSHIMWEDPRVRLVGHRLAKSWRPELVDVTVGERTFPGIHLVQLLVRRPEKDVEILVLYPHDGHWRAKPLPAPGFLDMPYGSSFLFGPVEKDRRHLVRYTGVRFDPETLAFTVGFAQGGEGRIRVLSAGSDELRLEAVLSRPVTGQPFALLSSMHVNEENSDVGRIRYRPAGSVTWNRIPPVTFMPPEGVEFDFGRDIPSRHNTFAPDMLFGPFTGP